MKNIIFVFSHYYGLTDNIKGLLTLYKITKIFNYTLKINFSFIKNINFKNYINNIYLNEDNNINPLYFIDNRSIESFKDFIYKNLTNTTENNIYITTNIDPFLFFENIWDREVKKDTEIYRNITKDFSIINEIFIFDKFILNNNYDTFHIRLGDHLLYTDLHNNTTIDIILDIINKQEINNKFTILCDNSNIYNHLLKKMNKELLDKFIKLTDDDQSIHFAHIINEEQLKKLLKDFYVLLKSRKIYTYNWSGFSYYPAAISSIDYIPLN